MADMFDAAKRSKIMSSIHSKNTKAELIVFEYLRRQGVYFQRHYNRALGCPDIALPRKKKACFIDGDFWHGRDLDRLREGGHTNDYWGQKILRNKARDLEQRGSLKDQGWEILEVWESDIVRKSTRESVLEEVKRFLVM